VHNFVYGSGCRENKSEQDGIRSCDLMHRIHVDSDLEPALDGTMSISSLAE